MKRHEAAVMVTGLAIAAAWLSMSRLQGDLDADAMIPVLASLQRWTPFFWDQDRFGQPWGLVATVVREPIYNLIVQSTLNACAAFAALYLTLVYTRRDDEDDVLVAFVLAAVLAVTTMPLPEWYGVFGTRQPYATSLAFTLGGLCLLERKTRWSMVAATTMCIVGAWVSVVVIVPTAPLVLARRRQRVTPPSVRETALALAILLVATVVSLLLSRVFGEVHETTATLSAASTWVSAWQQFGAHILERMHRGPWVEACTLVAAVGILTALCRRFPPPCRNRLGAALALGIAALGSTLVIGVTEWVRYSGYDVRYALYAVILLTAAAASSGACLLESVPMLRGRPVIAVAAILMAVGLTCGQPGPTVLRDALLARWGTTVDVVAPSYATHLAGDYWKVWPAAFLVAQRRYEHGDPRALWGLTYRSRATMSLSRAVPTDEVRVVVPADDPGAIPTARDLLAARALIPLSERPRAGLRFYRIVR